MKQSTFKRKGLKQKILLPVLLQSIVFIAVFSALVILSIRNQTDSKNTTIIENYIKSLQLLAKEQALAPLNSKDRDQKFDKLFSQISESNIDMFEKVIKIDAVKSLYYEINQVKEKNANIEAKILELTEKSITQSDEYIKQTVALLVNPARAASVSILQKQVLLGAHNNSVNSVHVQKLFYKMLKDINSKTEFFNLIDFLLVNVEEDLKNLANTEFAMLPVTAKAANLEIKALVNNYLENMANIENLTGIMVSSLEQLDSTINEVLTHNQLKAQKFLLLSSGILVFLVILTSSILIIAVNSVVSSVNKAAARMSDIAEGEGDLTKTLDIVSSDEVGEMAGYFNKTLEKIRKLVLEIKEKSDNLSEQGIELSANMDETASSIHQISANINSVQKQTSLQGNSLLATKTRMDDIERVIDSLDQQIVNQASSVSESSAAVEEMIANIRSVTQTVKKNMEDIEKLALASEHSKTELATGMEGIKKIEADSANLLEISKIIQTIASQTNLLSMNAAIEAAHAGEAGRGFAVVANEVRSLAESSGREAKNVAQTLKTIKATIDSIVVSMDAVQKKVLTIDSSVKGLVEKETLILNAMEEQSAGSKQILTAVSELEDISQKVKSGSGEMKNSSYDLKATVQELEKITVEIGNSMEEMSVGTREISQAVEKVHELSSTNKENIKALSDEVGRFKV